MKITNLMNEKEGRLSSIDNFAADVLLGLSSTPKRIQSKYFYDDIGSELFQKITQQPEYYLTRKEFEILESVQNTLPDLIKEKEIDIVELGVGDGHKSKLVIDGFLQSGVKVHFYPIDISEKAMHLLGENIQEQDDFKMHGIVADYFDGLRYVREISQNKQLALLLGSNIGNYTREQAGEFFQRLWRILNHDDYALVGFDLKKDISVLTSAYNDPKGYTKQFNLNLLTRINNELGANFELSQFQHFGAYNPLLGAMESYLVSLAKQEVYIEKIKKTFVFQEFEPMHLEYSYKYLEKDIEMVSNFSGFETLQHFKDQESYFVDSLWKVVKQ